MSESYAVSEKRELLLDRVRKFILDNGGIVKKSQLAGLGIERGDGGQSARLLHVKQAALVQRRQAGARVALDEIRALRPWDGRAEPLDGAGRRSVRAEEQVDAQRAGIRLIQRVKIRKKACFTEQALHLFFEFFRQWLHIT